MSIVRLPEYEAEFESEEFEIYALPRSDANSAVCRITIPLPQSRETAMTVSGKKNYDCTTCPYPRYKDRSMIFCDVCIRKILDEQNRKKQRKDDTDE